MIATNQTLKSNTMYHLPTCYIVHSRYCAMLKAFAGISSIYRTAPGADSVLSSRLVNE